MACGRGRPRRTGQRRQLALVRRQDVGQVERRALEAAGRGRVEDRRRAGDAGRGGAPRASAPVRISWPTSTTSPASSRSRLQRGPDLDRRQRRVRAAGDRDAVLAALVDQDQRDAGRPRRAAVTSPATSTPSASSAARAARPNASSPTAPTKDVGAPSRAAATAWLPPLPPWCCANRPPMTVSPGPGSRSVGDDEVDVDRADDDDPTAHGRVRSR